MSIEDVLNEYHNSLYYNEQWLKLALNGDVDSIVNIGTDFARSEMIEYAITCWQYVIDSGKSSAEAYSNLGVSYYYGNGVNKITKRLFCIIKKLLRKGIHSECITLQ